MTRRQGVNFDQTRIFDLERSNIWISFIFELIFVIGPFFVTWIFVGSFWNTGRFHNYYNVLPLKELVVVCIALGNVFFAILSNCAFYWLKWQKEDSFTYTMALALLLFSFIVNDLWILQVLSWSNVFTWIIRFVFILIFALCGMMLGAYLASLLRNHRFKIEEENEQLLLAYETDQTILSINEMRLQKALAYRQKKIADQLMLQEFKAQLNAEVDQVLAEKHLAKLEAKEAKLRKKQTQKINKKKK